MSLSVSTRPSKEILDIESTLNSVHLPIQYILESDLFPVNSDDTTYSVTGVASNALGITVTTSVAHGRVAKEWVKLTGFSEDYNGVFQVLSAPTTTTMVLGVAYVANDTGSLVKHYNNYHAKVRIYAGLPAYHGDNASKPMGLVTTLNVVPNSDNEVIVNVAPLVKQLIQMNVDEDNLNPDFNQICAFYIEFAESYDSVSGGSVVTTTTSYTTDTVSGCTASTELVTGGAFTGGYGDWGLETVVIEALGYTIFTQWMYGTNNVQVVFSGSGVSSELVQAIDFFPYVTYTLSYDMTKTATFQSISVYLYDTTRGDYQLVSFKFGTSVTTVFTPNNTYDEVHIIAQSVGASTITLDNFSILSGECNYYIWAINGVLNFNDPNGGNFADYYINERYLTDLLSNSPIMYPDKDFHVSAFLPNSVLSSNGDVAFRVNVKDRNKDLIKTQDVLVTSGNDGIYHRKINGIFSPYEDAKFGDVRLIKIPDTILTGADQGTFESTFASWSSLFGYLGNVSEYGASSAQAYQGSQSFGISDGGFTVDIIGSHVVYYDEGVTLEAGASYDFTAWIFADGAQRVAANLPPTSLRISLRDQSGNASVEIKEELFINGIDGTPSDISTFNFSRTQRTDFAAPLSADSWIQLRSTFTNNTSGTIVAKPSIFMNDTNESFGEISFGINVAGFIFYTDSWLFKGPFINLTNLLSFEVDNECTDQDFYLAWLNPLGGYDFHNFSGRKLNSLEISGDEIYRRPTNNWDSGFINNKFAHDQISVKARNQYQLFSKPLTIDQVDRIESVFYSPKVYKVVGSNWIGVNVIKQSVTKYTDREKLIVLSMTVQDTDFIRVQQQ